MARAPSATSTRRTTKWPRSGIARKGWPRVWSDGLCHPPVTNFHLCSIHMWRGCCTGEKGGKEVPLEGARTREIFSVEFSACLSKQGKYRSGRNFIRFVNSWIFQHLPPLFASRWNGPRASVTDTANYRVALWPRRSRGTGKREKVKEVLDFSQDRV